MTSYFTDSDDDDLMIPLSRRLAAKGVCISSSDRQVEGVFVLDDDSNLEPIEILDLAVSDNTRTAIDDIIVSRKTVTSLRRSVTLADFSPSAAKCKQKRDTSTPAKVTSQKSDDILPTSTSPSSIKSCHSKQTSITDYGKAKKKPSKAAKKTSSSQESQTSIGKAPLRKESSRDCLAIISSNLFNNNFITEADVGKTFSEYDVRYRRLQVEDLEDAPTVTWMRSIEGEDGKIIEVPEKELLVILDKVKTVKLIGGSNEISLGQEDVVSLDSDFEDPITHRSSFKKKDTLVSFVEDLSMRHPGSNITLIITGMTSYFRSLNNKEVNAFKALINDKKKVKRRKSLGLPVITESELMEALIDIEFSTQMIGGSSVRSVLCEKSSDVLNHIASYSKSVAEAPFKKQRQDMNSMAWFAENDNKGTVDIDDLVKDVPRLWSKQLQQFPKISKDVAEAIVGVYPSVNSLMTAYQVMGEKEGKDLLADIQVGKTGRRRIGSEISSRIFIFLTSNDPSTFVCRETK